MSQVVERYATALYEVTQAKGLVAQTLEVLEALQISLEDHGELAPFLSTPLISSAEKEETLKKLVGEALNDDLAAFLSLVVKNKRTTEFPQIVEAYRARVTQAKGVERGKVRSAIELTDEEKQKVQGAIQQKLQKDLHLTYVVDPEMIGGIEAQVGSFIFEDSIKNHMQKLNDFVVKSPSGSFD